MGCSAVWRVPDRVVAVISVALTLDAATSPLTLRDESAPTLVMLGWAAVVSVPSMLVAVRFPTAALPLTDSVDSVPTEVILGCSAVVSSPEMLSAVRFDTVKLPVPEIALRSKAL